MPEGIFPDGFDLEPDKLPRVDGAGDDRAKTVVLVYTTNEEASFIKERLGIDPNHSFDQRKMFPVRELWECTE